MGKLRRWIDVPGPISAVEDLWYDTRRWSGWVDGVDKVVKVEGEYPRSGARVVWDSPREGRGRVQEVVQRYVRREQQVTLVEDEKLRGEQTVAFELNPDDSVHVSLELRYTLKTGGPFAPLIDLLGVRRALAISLHTTLGRFRAERVSDLRDERELRAL